MARRVVTVFGGSGFFGRHLVKRLAAAGATVRVAVRDPESANFLKPLGDVGQIVPWPADVAERDTLAPALAGATAAVNLVGILYERGRRTFQRIHAEGAGHVAEAAAAAGLQRLVHVSALGADLESGSAYARTKAAGEAAVRRAFPSATIFRPSVVFGPEDGFFNRFAAIARLSPFLPLFGCGTAPDGTQRDGGTRFQPVYVGDVAAAIVAALERDDALGRTYELGGPKVMSFRQVMELVLAETGRKRLLVPVPFALGKLQAVFLQFLPTPPLTPDQVELLKADNVVSPGAPGLAALGVTATAPEIIVPTYLRRFRRPRPASAALV